MPKQEDIPEKYKKAVNDIADSLLAGFVCFFNPATLEVESFPQGLVEDPEEYELITGETWGNEERKHLRWEKTIEIAPMDSSDSFKVMEHFAEQVNDHDIQNKLFSALNNQRPFAHFKALVEGSKYREQWFGFRQQAYEYYVWDLIRPQWES